MFFHFNRQSVKYPKELAFNNSDFLYKWESEVNNNSLEFKTINLFVGANNSGKSRFLRGIIKTENNVDLLSKKKEHFSILLKNYNSYYNSHFGELSYNFRGQYSRGIKDFPFHNNEFKALISNVKKYESSFSFINDLRETLNKQETLNANERKELKFLDQVNHIIQELIYIDKNQPLNKHYIPVLRSTHENNYFKDGIIKDTVKLNYGIDRNIHTGLELYEKVKSLKNSQGLNRKKVKKFEKFLSKHFFENKEVEITANTNPKELLFSIDEIEYPIYNLGDGIQSLIILLFPIFTADKNEWFFIEEPEINLHPGLQRVFIQTLLYDSYLKNKNLKYFFTTHSNHLLDTTLLNDEVSIFQFEKKDEKNFQIKSRVKPNKEVLNVLGVNTSSVFLANTSVWIEGPTDRKYLSKLLNLYSEEKQNLLKEDIDFAFFEYGGNLIQHYLFDESIDFESEVVREKINSFALSNKIYLLADNDNVDRRSAKGKRRKLLEENAIKNPNFYYQNTELREIENLLPKVLIKDFLNSLVKGLKDIEALKLIDFNKSDYDKKGLGEFYEELLVSNGVPKKQHKSFKAESGTLKNDYKIMLADFVINSEYKYEDFIEDNDILKQIIEDLYEFIKS
ncbi:AAA family ATPase [Winogradskyella sp.]|uniref:AAA family ATPase n=1 Tax=Winogradskyella sp. TaxID=1883156 RepID=UPI003AB24001